jgi:hypothetical protein
VDNQFRANDKIEEFPCYLREYRFICELISADAVNLLGTHINIPLGINIAVEMTAGQSSID